MLKTADGGNPDVVDKSIRRTPGRQTSRAGQSGPEKGDDDRLWGKGGVGGEGMGGEGREGEGMGWDGRG